MNIKTQWTIVLAAGALVFQTSAATTLSIDAAGPLTAIILIVVLGNPSPYLVALIVTSVATALILGALLKPIMERRIREKAAPSAG